MVDAPTKGERKTVKGKLIPEELLYEKFAKKDGSGDMERWDVVFRGNPTIGGHPIHGRTFSSTVAPIIESLKGQPIDEVELAFTGQQFQGIDKWSIERVFHGGKLLYPDEVKKASTRRSGPSHPEWSYETPEERLDKSQRFEAQASQERATAIIAHSVALYGHAAAYEGIEDPVGFVVAAAVELGSVAQDLSVDFLNDLRKAHGGDPVEKKSGTDSRSEKGRPPKKASGQQREVTGSIAPTEASAPSLPPSQDGVALDGEPASVPDSSSAGVGEL